MDAIVVLGGSTDQDSVLETAKRKTLVETNAQSVLENLQTLKAFPMDHRRRWIWELLQNASDAADPSTGKSRVRVEVDERKVRFRHNGAAFKPLEITHLIYHGSTKQEEEGKKGKFGSGFLTVHLLSRKVRVEGVLLDGESSKHFEFLLDRSGDTAKEIEERMETAWLQFKESRRDGIVSGGYTTAYECELEGDAEAVVNSGLEDLERALPYVLAFAEELEEVTVAVRSEMVTWTRSVRDAVDGVTRADVARSVSGAEPETFKVVFAGDPKNGVAVAALLKKSGETWRVVSDKEAPRLFYPLPLAGTDELALPFAAASATFEPVPERNGIFAGSGDDAPTRRNWRLLGLVPRLFATLVEACVKERWRGVEKLGRFENSPAAKWLDGKRFVSEVLAPCVGYLRGKEGPQIVWNSGERPVRISEAAIPVQDPERKLYSLAERVVGLHERLPAVDTSGEWATTLEGWALILGVGVEQLGESLTLERLADRVEGARSLDGLSALLSPVPEKAALDWLNEVFGAVPKERLQAFVKARGIVPNQDGVLKKESELRLDGGIDEGLKDICALLGEAVRGELLQSGVHDSVKQLFRGVRGRSLGGEDCLERALKRVMAPAEKGKEDVYQQGNAKLLVWLIGARRKEKLSTYPVVCAAGTGKLGGGRPVLWPACLWEQRAAGFADVFGGERRLADAYSEYLSNEEWDYLEREGFVLKSVFGSERLEVFDPLQVKGGLAEDCEHKPAGDCNISEIRFLKGDGGVLDGLRKSEQKAGRFLEFVLCCAIKADRSWVEGYAVNCFCGKAHAVTTGWLHLIMNHNWVPVGRGRGERPSAATLSKLLNEGLKQTILSDADAAQFLLKIGVGVSELVRSGVPESQWFRLDQLSARIYGSADPATVESIEAILDDPDIQKGVLQKRDEKRKVARNQVVGRAVEELLRRELEGAGIRVTRTGVGSDFELEADYIEDGVEQMLQVSKYLLEVKSTTECHVRMTLRQGQEAVRNENRDRYVLCVVDAIGGGVNEAMVRERARFVFGIADMVDEEVKEAAALKVIEGDLTGGGSDLVKVDIIASSVKLRLSQEVWVGKGISFEAFVSRVRQGESGSPGFGGGLNRGPSEV